jgi:hypothetical protein
VAVDHGPDPFQNSGGGSFVEGVGWVDKNSPYYQPPAGAPGNTAPDGQTPGTNAGTTSTGAQNSSTPGAAPTTNTTNQGVQDTVRNTYLTQATQNPIPTAQDPQIAAQVDPYRAEVERQKNDYLDQQAEAAGPYATGALRGQERMASEKAGQNVGGFAASLVGNELVARRAEIQHALDSLSGTLSDDQARALQQKLADLDAQIKMAGINTAAASTAAGQDIQKSLGIGQLNLGLLNALLGNQQFGDQLGFNIANAEQGYNQTSGASLLG